MFMLMFQTKCSYFVLQIILILYKPNVALASEPPSTTLFQQLFRSWSRLLGETLGFARLLLNSLNPPSTPDLIKQRGYSVESHYVKTVDDVTLEIHRIPNGHHVELFRLTPKIPVLLVHGIAQSSSDFVLNTPSKNSLAYFLADEGYDVWLANMRGVSNQYTINGYYSWNYSFHEMGIYDIPAIVQHILEQTNSGKIHFIGFSMGSTAFMTALSKIPQLNSRFKMGVLLGPSVFQDNYYNGWLKLVAPLATPAEALQSRFGPISIFHPRIANILHRVLPIICHPRIDIIGICLTVVQLIFGNDKGQITKDKLALITKVSPTPISSKLLVHYMQHLRSGRFSEYDYGLDKNVKLYGTRSPPDYNLTNVIIPISLVVGPEDLHARRLDAITLANKLPNVVDFHIVPYQHFHHLDFCYAEDAGPLVYYHVLKLLKSFDEA